MLYKIFTLNTKIKTTIITICALSYNLTAQASPSYRPRDRVNKTMIELQTNGVGNDSNLLIVFYVQIVPDDFVMQLHRF